MANFIYNTGTGGLITSTAVSLMTTELNSLAVTDTAESSVGGSTSNGWYKQTDFNSALFGYIQLSLGGAMTAVAGDVLLGWFLKSLDNESTLEYFVANAIKSRPQDFEIPFDVGTYASGNKVASARVVEIPAVPFKVLVYNGNASAALPSSSNVLSIGPFVETFA
jgi:hypothetical protein